jgi:hypothetical protein
MKKRNLTILTAGALMLSLASCGGSDEKKTGVPQEQEQPVLQEADPQHLGFGDEGGRTYSVPSPNELFSIIKEGKLPYKEGIISTDGVNYGSSTEQALNFGRLTADIAYTASYERFQESTANFDNLRKIGDELGISYVFDELMVNRVKDNMDNPDSLEVISTSSYQRIIGMLEENEKGSTLAIIATGGFVESIYILTNLIGEYEEGSETITRLADEKIVMENVIDYLKMYDDEERVQTVLKDIEPITNVFLNLQEVEKTIERKGDGDKVVLGGTKVIMTKQEFEALKAAATEYRNSFANGSQS